MMDRNRTEKSLKKDLLRIGAALFAAACFFLSVKAADAWGAPQEELYLAGAPKEWPLEYYDRKSDDYRGVIPDLLREAAEQAGRGIRYIRPSFTDGRLHLAANLQVDAVCGLGLEEKKLQEAGLTEGPCLTSYQKDGEEVRVMLYYTRGASEEDRKALETALAEIPPERIRGLYLDYAQSGGAGTRADNGRMAVLAVLAVCGTAVSIALLFRLSRQKRLAVQTSCRDDVTERDNFSAWTQTYTRRVTGENREHYAILYLSTGIDTIAHIYGYREAGEAVKLVSDVCTSRVNGQTEGFSRFQNHDFVFFIRYESVEAMKERVKTMQTEIAAAFKEAKKSYFLELYTGIYRLKSIDDDLLQVVQSAEVAGEYANMYALDMAVYDEYVEDAAVSGYAMEHEAIHGLMHREFIVYFQPIVDMETGEILSAEALVRWQNPKRGLLRPEEFLKVMKRKQLMGKLNMEIYRQGCGFLKKQLEEGRRLRLLVNFTSENMGDNQFVPYLSAVAKQYGIDPGQVVIQLNQMVEISRQESFQEVIKNLRSAGFDVCLAGLELDRVFFEYLESGANLIKLRHELICRIGTPEGYKVLSGIIDICRGLGLKIFCMGVEDQEQVRLLKELGCRMASGFYYYYPVSREVFEELLRNESKGDKR